MAVLEKPQQHAIRRSTRLPLEVPVRIVSLDPEFPFSEPCNTSIVNAHGCGVIAPRAPKPGIKVRIEIVAAKRHTAARVAEVVSLGGERETWLVGLEFEIPGNFWGIDYAPSDWKIEEAPEAKQPAAKGAAKSPAARRRWRLTDISTGACYLESAAPLPRGIPILISVRSQEQEYVLEGVVRASHPQAGMAVEFARTQGHRQRVADLIEHLTRHREVPKIFVGKKEVGRAGSGEELHSETEPGDGESGSVSDPLLELVRQGPSLSPEQFLSDLRNQRLGKRRDPRVDVAVPVLVTGTDAKGRPLDQRAMTVNVSRRGALLRGIHGTPSPGDEISLTRGNRKEEFCVAWVADDQSGAGSLIGVAAVDPNSSFWDEVLQSALIEPGESAPEVSL